MHGNNKIHYMSFKSKGCCCNDHHTDNIQCIEHLSNATDNFLCKISNHVVNIHQALI